MKSLSVLISLQVVAVAVLLSARSAQSGIVPQWPGQYAISIKNYPLNIIKDNVLDRSGMKSSFQDTMAEIKSRYDKEKQSLGATATDEEQQALYYKIVVDEIRNLRARISKNSGKDVNNGSDGSNDFKPYTESKIITSDDEILDPDVDIEEEKELLNQLDELEALDNESEMGWSMDPEQRRQLSERTKKVLTDLIQNELKQLAMTLITSYMSGSPFGPIAGALAASIKFKVVEYLMNVVTDALASFMGRRPIVSPLVSPEASPLVSPEASPEVSPEVSPVASPKVSPLVS